jgi:hypothetical protein
VRVAEGVEPLRGTKAGYLRGADPLGKGFSTKLAGPVARAIKRPCAHSLSKWIRVLHRCWIDRTPYDESRYLMPLQSAGHRCSSLPRSLRPEHHSLRCGPPQCLSWTAAFSHDLIRRRLV